MPIVTGSGSSRSAGRAAVWVVSRIVVWEPRAGMRLGHRGSENRRSVPRDRRKDTTMAEGPRMTAAQLADKLLSDELADVVRESVAWMVAELMEAEVTALIGAAHGERTPERTAQRNGHRTRGWDTRVGEIEVAIPKLRTGS